MKINRFIGLAAIALLAIGAMGFISTRSYAQTVAPTALQAQVTAAPDKEEPANSVDTDQIEEQVGDQSGPDTGTEVANETSEPAGTDGQDALPSGTPAITADAALKAAQTYLNTTATGRVSLDDENGKLVYSVELNGSDVKVDAMNGTVLGVDQAGEDQSEVGN